MAKFSIRATISATAKPFQAAMGQVKATAIATARGIKASFATVGGFLTASLAPLLTILAPLLGVIGAITGLKKALGTAGAEEQTLVALENIIGSSERARDILQELTEFSDVTPFEPDDVIRAGEQLVKTGIAAGEVVDIVKELGAVSKDGQQLVELTDALSKGFAKGKFQTEELNKFLERGIPLREALSKTTGKVGDELQKAIEKGLGFDDVRAALASLSDEGGQFFGILEAQSKTSIGLISTIKGLVTALFREFGRPLNDAIKPLLQGTITGLRALQDRARSLGESIASIFRVVTKNVSEGTLGELIATGLILGARRFGNAMIESSKVALEFIVSGLSEIGGVIRSGFSLITDPSFWRGVGNLAQSALLGAVTVMAAALEPILKRIPGLGGSAGVQAGIRQNRRASEEGFALGQKQLEEALRDSGTRKAAEDMWSAALKGAQEELRTETDFFDTAAQVQRLRELTAVQKSAEEGMNRAAQAITEASGEADQETSAEKSRTANALAAFRSIGGRDPIGVALNSNVVDIAKKQLSQLEKNTKQLEGIKDAIENGQAQGVANVPFATFS